MGAVIIDGVERGVMRVRPQAELDGVGEVSLSLKKILESDNSFYGR